MTLKTLEPSATLAMNELSAELRQQGRTVHRFGFGESPFGPPPRVLDAFRGAVNRTEYAPVQGLLELRERVAELHAAVDGLDTDPDHVLIGSGSKIQLLNSLLAFDDAVVVIPSPSWVSYAQQVRLAGHDLRVIGTTFEERWRLDPERLDAVLGEVPAGLDKVLILNHPGNPDGLSYREAELEALSGVLRRHGAWAISDEIYGLLHHAGGHVSMARTYPERTIVTSGLSKWCGAGGWRLGVQLLSVQAPSELVRTLNSLAASTYSCAPTPVQVAAAAAYVYDYETRAHLKSQRDVLTGVQQVLLELIRQSQIKVHPGEGGFYLFLDFSSLRERLSDRGITTDVQLCSRLLETTGVALLPGSSFVMDPYALTARLAYVDFDGDAVLETLRSTNERPLEVVQHSISNMRSGVQAMVDWCKP